MLNKKRPSKRTPKLPNKFNDHIMSNLSKKRNDSNDIDDFDAIRVGTEDKVENFGEIRENSKEMDKEGVECVDEMIRTGAEVTGNSIKNVGEESGETGKKVNKGVFGTSDKGNEYDVSGVDAEVESARRLSKDPSVGNAGNSDPIIDCTKIVNNNPDCDVMHKDNSNTESNKKSYANKLTNGVNANDNELFFIPTVMKENGEKLVIFDEELVKEGSEKWKFTVCGYFVGYRMGVNELRYNVRRMWGRYGLKDSVVDADEMCYFKFKNEEGMNYVIDQSPWLINIPLEAWSVRGISALASRLGRHIKMDQVTADMCRAGTKRLGYARVMIEINVEDEFFDKIEINYVDDIKKVKSTKWVKVEYTWKPDRCNHCKVFGHSMQNYDVKPKPKPVVNNNTRANDAIYMEGNKQQQAGVKVAFRPKEPKAKHELRKSANKYAVLSDDENNIEVDPFTDKRLVRNSVFSEVMIIIDLTSLQAMIKFEKQTFSKLQINQDEVFRMGFEQEYEHNVNTRVRNRLSNEFEPLVKNVNLQLNCFENSLVKEMKNDLKYVMSLEDEFDETCLMLDIQQEFFKTQFESAISESYSHVYKNEMFEQKYALENENCCLKKTISQIKKDFSKIEAQSIASEIALQHKIQENNSLKTIQTKYENFVASLQIENAHLK
ncbi:RNA-directed DNA polymerase, eukaryota, reverse transcriptase zinc-binding domain protein [Tanacetum coccineum]